MGPAESSFIKSAEDVDLGGSSFAGGVPIAPAHRKLETVRHSGVVRVTHWITFIAFVALIYSGGEIVISHPRFYWGEVGNVMTRPLFTLPIPSSRRTVPTGFNFVMTDQNGWSRALHMEAAWALVLTGLVYCICGLWTGHFEKDLFPKPAHRRWQAFRNIAASRLRSSPPGEAEDHSYNLVQRATYLVVIFLLFPLMIWTGLAMSPAIASTFPLSVILLGGRQSARTIHFFVSWFLLFFLVGHVTMVAVSGFWSRTRAMITGRAAVRRRRA